MAKATKSTKAPKSSTKAQNAPAAAESPSQTAMQCDAAPTKNERKAKVAAEKPKRTSALDAAAKVLAEASEPMNTKAMIETMASKGYWSSPNGQTPQATLYSAILREITVKKEASRFCKADRGLFALNARA